MYQYSQTAGNINNVNNKACIIQTNHVNHKWNNKEDLVYNNYEEKVFEETKSICIRNYRLAKLSFIMYSL